MEGLKVSDADLVLRVPPSKSSRASQAILRELSSHLFQFSEIFDGVLLAYDVDIVDQNAKIIQVIQPSSGVRLKAKLLLFSPKPNMSLEGRVVKLTPESIHVIVLGFASAVIIDEDIREEFEFRTDLNSVLKGIMAVSTHILQKHGKEVFRSKAHSRHVIKVGTVIRFLVKRCFHLFILHTLFLVSLPMSGWECPRI
ncbi:DNA-directed RNA polymerase I subunit rpa43-like isoform X3 [Rhodamnia argentea]|uniref:DNA-directed RNA polymerase subunit n=1 Tax=Rhodamnia argentea TaxID=178133 RepID=A0ABM3H2F9_9MYRT|nr:DNA-directed RNA polymerase I subunit rpa43-like isoform X3 [Rhodamnia argentea]